MDELKRKSLISDKIKFGQFSLLDSSELLALVASSSPTDESIANYNSILTQFNGDLAALLSLNQNRLIKEFRISSKSATKLIAIGELARRAKFSQTSDNNTVRNSNEIAKLFSSQFSGVDNEQLWVVYLNNGNRVLEKRKISDGSTGEVVADVKIIIRQALKLMATKMILVHNHPSSILTPSSKDIALTEKVRQAAAYFDIKLLDHLIISPEGEYYSFNDSCI